MDRLKCVTSGMLAVAVEGDDVCFLFLTCSARSILTPFVWDWSHVIGQDRCRFETSYLVPIRLRGGSDIGLIPRPSYQIHAQSIVRMYLWVHHYGFLEQEILTPKHPAGSVLIARNRSLNPRNTFADWRGNWMTVQWPVIVSINGAKVHDALV